MIVTKSLRLSVSWELLPLLLFQIFYNKTISMAYTILLCYIENIYYFLFIWNKHKPTI